MWRRGHWSLTALSGARSMAPGNFCPPRHACGQRSGGPAGQGGGEVGWPRCIRIDWECSRGRFRSMRVQIERQRIDQIGGRRVGRCALPAAACLVPSAGCPARGALPISASLRFPSGRLSSPTFGWLVLRQRRVRKILRRRRSVASNLFTKRSRDGRISLWAACE